MSKRILVTGATGYIGKELVPALLAGGWEVACLVRDREVAARVPGLAGAELFKGDLGDPDSLRVAVQGCEAAAHLAVLGHVNKEGTTQERFDRVNVEGTDNVLAACREAGVGRIICCSTTAAIGRPDGNVIDETTPLRPITPYGRSKKVAEEHVVACAREQGLPIVLLAFPHVFGPGDVRDFLKITRMVKKGVFPQIGREPNYFPACYLSEAVYGIQLALEQGRPGEKYMIADEDPHDLCDIRRFIRAELGMKPDAFYPVVPAWALLGAARAVEGLFGLVGKVPPVRASNIKNLALGRRVDITKARQELGFTHRVGLEQAIKEIISWYRKHQMI